MEYKLYNMDLDAAYYIKKNNCILKLTDEQIKEIEKILNQKDNPLPVIIPASEIEII